MSMLGFTVSTIITILFLRLALTKSESELS
jgi:hypothetical protein